MKLYKFDYSPYARKVQALLDLMGARYTPIEVPYADRNELATVTGGYIYVPVLVDDGDQVITDSRRICEHLVAGAAARFVPARLEGPVWAYHDWCDNQLEDVLFRLSSPFIARRWRTAHERALYILIKERKFGAGCVDAWERDQAGLIERGRKLLAPSARTLAAQPFLFGEQPTLADVALYGNFAMLGAADPGLVGRFQPEFAGFVRRIEELTAAARAPR